MINVYLRFTTFLKCSSVFTSTLTSKFVSMEETDNNQSYNEEIENNIDCSPTKEKPKIIQAINKNAVHRICSGQVVLNLAIAVKELVENSLDAGATSVEVRLKEYGSKLIEVIDNGCGVDEANFQGLTLKHHTSKLQDFSDLVSVATFGFRGEALSSLCALSDMSVVTRHADATCATQLRYDHAGHIASQATCARQVGTTVSVGNLFGTLPVRQKEFHRNLKREFGKMTQMLYAYCLVATNVKITCSNQSAKGSRSVIASTNGSKTVRENIVSVFGAKQVQSLVELEPLQSDTFLVQGHVSSCGHGQGRGASDRQFYYVNSRPCEPNKITKLVNEVYHTFNSHQQPFVFLNINMQRSDVDVNVTPDKRQVFLEHEKQLLAAIKTSLLQLYESTPSTFQYQNTPSPAPTPTTAITAPSTAGRLTALLSRWKHPTSTDTQKGVKRASEEEADAADNPKQPCIMNFFKRQSTSNKPSCEQDLPDSPDVNNTDGSGLHLKIEHETRQDSFGCDITIVQATEDNLEDFVDEFDSDFKADRKPNETEQFVNDDERNSSRINLVEQVFHNGAIKIESEDSNLEATLTDNARDTKVVLQEVKATVKGDEVRLTDETSLDESEVRLDAARPQGFKRRTVWSSITLDQIRDKLARREVRKKDAALVVRFRAAIEPSKNKTAEQELGREIAKHMFQEMQIVGQFNLGFIITRLDSDLFIIDQHASDEKYNFETLQLTQALTSQRLVHPVALQLSAVAESVLTENIHVFKSNGFAFVIDETAAVTKRVKLSAIPVSRNWVFGKEDVDELLFMLQDAGPGTMCRPSRVRDMFASRACRKSVMIGSALSQSDMRRLVDNMGKIEQPWNCPHGRPTMRHLVNLDLIHSSA